MTVKVLIVSDYRDPVSTRPEAEAVIGLKKSGVHIDVMSFEDSPWRGKFEAVGIRYIPFHPVQKFNLEAIRFMRKTMREEGYHVVHFFNSRASINGIQAARGLAIKIVLYRGFEGHVHWYDPTSYLKYLNPRVDRIMCITAAAANHIREQKFFDSSKAIVIHKGHHPSWYANYIPADLSVLGIPKDAVTVINVANVRPMKGIPYLLKATYKIPSQLPIHYLFVGKGMDAPHIQQLIKESPNQEKIHILGFRKDVLNIVKASDIFALPSLWGESINKATIEAMSLGVAPIISDINGNTPLVQDGVNGLVYPTKNEQAIADAILKLYHHPNLRKQFAQQAKEHIRTNLHIDNTVKQMKEMYEELASELVEAGKLV